MTCQMLRPFVWALSWLQSVQQVLRGMHALQAGQIYRWRMVGATTMKWMDLSLNGTGCTMGIYSRDGIFLRDFPRIVDHIVISSANRWRHII